MALTDPLCRSFLDLWWHFDPAAATHADVPGHDGRLGAFDPDSLRLHVAAFRSIAGAVEDLEVETAADEIDRTALLDHVRVLIFRFEHEHPYQKNPALWVEHLVSAFEGLLARPPGDPALAAAALDRLRALPRFAQDARDSLRQPPLFLVEAALAQLAALSGLLDETAERFAAEWSLEGIGAAAMTEAHASLSQLGAALRGQSPDPDPHAAAIGEDEVDRRLHHEHASIHNAAEILRATLRLATEVELEIKVLAAAIDPGVDWRELYESEREELGLWSELRAELLEALAAAREFAASHGLRLAAAPLEVREASAAAQLLEPVACYRPAAGPRPAALLVADAERAAIPWLAARLGVPGLHFHLARRDALPGLVRRHITAASTPLGWSLYAQELMGELGYGGEPGSHLAERVLLLREVHLALVDLGLHTRQLTPDAAVAHLLRHLPTEHRVALADVRRLACRPTSACAAMLGRQELRRLRDDVRAARPEGFTLDGFHQALFAYGGLPVPLIRWGMGVDA